jgi:hypothetical protein
MRLGNYLWYAPYYEAICETDDSLMPGRILEARAALEQRLLSPIEPSSEEMRAILNAQTSLERLRAERIDQYEAQSSHPIGPPEQFLAR